MKTTLWLIALVLIKATDFEFINITGGILFSFLLPASMFLDIVDLIDNWHYLKDDE